MTVFKKTIRPCEKPKEIKLSRYIKSPEDGDTIEFSIAELSADTKGFFATFYEIVPEIVIEPETTTTVVFRNGKWTCPQIGYEFCQSKIMHYLYNLKAETDDKLLASNIDSFLDKCWKSKNTKAMYHGMKYESYDKFPSIKNMKIEKFEMEYLNTVV